MSRDSVNDFVKLDYYASIFLNRLLKRDLSFFQDDFLVFSKEQLATITEVTLTGFENISFLKYLPNLKTLRLRSADYNKVTEDSSFDTVFFNRISSHNLNRTLNFLPQLETFELINDISVTKLDVSSLQNLKNLTIQNCPELVELAGISSLRRLQNVRIFGNNIKEVDDLFKYLLHTNDTNSNLIDIGMFFSGVKSATDIENLLELKLRGLINVEFTEKNGLVGYTKLELEQVCALYAHFKKLFKQKGLFNAPDYQKINYVLDYIQRNVRFASDELDERERFIHQYVQEKGDTPDWAVRYLAYLHSSYTTFKRKKGNCEGIVNLIRFMLGTLEVFSEDVQCNDKRSGMISTTNHAIVRVKLDDEYYYFDPSYNSKQRKEYYYMSYEDASKYLDLSLYEAQKVKAGKDNEQRQLYKKIDK